MKKFFVVFGIFVGVLFLLVLVMVGVMVFLVSSNNNDKGGYSEVLPGPDSTAPKALVVYQPTIKSTGKTIAGKIAAGLNEAGYEVTISYPSEKLSEDISAYSIVTFGSSVYAGQPSTALVNYMKRITGYSGKTILLYSIGSSKDTPEIDILEACITGDAKIIREKFDATAKDNADIAGKLGTDLAGKPGTDLAGQ